MNKKFVCSYIFLYNFLLGCLKLIDFNINTEYFGKNKNKKKEWLKYLEEISNFLRFYTTWCMISFEILKQAFLDIVQSSPQGWDKY